MYLFSTFVQSLVLKIQSQFQEGYFAAILPLPTDTSQIQQLKHSFSISKESN